MNEQPEKFTCDEIVAIELEVAAQMQPAIVARSQNWPGQVAAQRKLVLEKQAEFEQSPDEQQAEELAIAQEKLQRLIFIEQAANGLIEKTSPVLTKSLAKLFDAAFAKRFDALAEREAVPRGQMAERVAHLIMSGMHPRAASESSPDIGPLNIIVEGFGRERQSAAEARHYCAIWQPGSTGRTFSELFECLTRPFPNT